MLVFVNGMLFLLSYAEGRQSFICLYYLPLIFCIPFILNDNRKYHLELFTFVMVSALSALASIFLSPENPGWEIIDSEQLKNLFYINTCITLGVTVFFALCVIYSERFFKDVLNTQLHRAEASNLMKNRFLAGTSHELRTALNGVTSAAYMLQAEEHFKTQEEHFKVLQYCSDHMINIVNEILDYDRIESGKLELNPRVFDIGRLLHDAHLPFYQVTKEKNISFISNIDEQLYNQRVFADDFRLLQVVNNLLSNALKFTDEGSVRLDAIVTKMEDKTFRLLVSVTDTGIGIEEENIEKIFSGFWQVYNERTLTNRGSGLGLSISKKLLQLMNSDLAVKSKPGEGSSFSFEIELQKTLAMYENKKTPIDKEIMLTGMHILVAEDDPINLIVATKILEAKKAIVHKAVNGAEVLRILEENIDIQLILMDLEMPVMNGYTAIAEIAKRYPSLPVIAFTAAILDKRTEDQLKKSGFRECISKPFEPEIFFSKVGQVIN